MAKEPNIDKLRVEVLRSEIESLEWEIKFLQEKALMAVTVLTEKLTENKIKCDLCDLAASIKLRDAFKQNHPEWGKCKDRALHYLEALTALGYRI